MMVSSDNSSVVALGQLLHDVANLNPEAAKVCISQIVMDSRHVNMGSLFIAVPGVNGDGRDYIDDALSRGAAAILWECEQGTIPIPVAWRSNGAHKKIPVIGVADLNSKVGVIADRYYHEPSKSLFMIGITGTNGKTSCSHFVAQSLSGISSCAVMGTMGWGFIDQLQPSKHTTPDVIACHSQLHTLKLQGTQCVAMEVSSHALEQRRVDNIHFDCAVFTNLTHEHLDYHGSMDNYAKAKQKLFQFEDLRYYVINQDDEFGRQLITHAGAGVECISYGLTSEQGQPTIFADAIVQDASGLSFDLFINANKYHITTSIYGLFNISNLLATAGVLLAKGVEPNEIAERLSHLFGIDGRMEVIRTANSPAFIIDYAHTPDALESVLKTIREHFSGQVYCVFGCGGDRDVQKRPAMASIAELHADQVILTNDNPRTEPPVRIVADLLSGMKDPDQAIVELDRAEAIRKAYQQATVDDVILVAGKGHETYQVFGTQSIDFSDKAVVRELIGEDEHA